MGLGWRKTSPGSGVSNIDARDAKYPRDTHTATHRYHRVTTCFVRARFSGEWTCDGSCDLAGLLCDSSNESNESVLSSPRANPKSHSCEGQPRRNTQHRTREVCAPCGKSSCCGWLRKGQAQLKIITHLQVTRLGQQDVGGLDVAVNDTRRVDVLEGLQQLWRKRPAHSTRERQA